MRYGYEQNDLDFQSIVREIVAAHDWSTLLSVTEGSGTPPLPHEVWEQLQMVGLRGLTVADDLGGGGADWTTLAAAVEALAATVTPVPVLPQIVAIEALLNPAAGLPETARARLVDLYLASGERHSPSGEGPGDGEPIANSPVAAAISIGGCDATASPLTITGDEGKETVHGSLRGILHPGNARRLVVPVTRGGVVELAVVNARRSLTETPSLDHSRPLADLTFEAAPVIKRLAGDGAIDAWRYLRRWLEIMIAVENVGVADAALKRSTEYATCRVQFDAPLSDNQVIRHALADSFMSVYEADAVVHEAIRVQSELSQSPTAKALAEADLIAALAVNASSRSAVHVTEGMLQIHGGIGFTWESDVHVLLKRAIGNRLLPSSPDQHRAKIAQLVGF